MKSSPKRFWRFKKKIYKRRSFKLVYAIDDESSFNFLEEIYNFVGNKNIKYKQKLLKIRKL